MKPELEQRCQEICDKFIDSFKSDDEVEVQCAYIFLSIIRAAAEFWENSDPLDFCIQHNSGEVIVFGGWNRLCWTAQRGFYPSVSHCNSTFLKTCIQKGVYNG
jgi:hypothetical protein